MTTTSGTSAAARRSTARAGKRLPIDWRRSRRVQLARPFKCVRHTSGERAQDRFALIAQRSNDNSLLIPPDYTQPVDSGMLAPKFPTRPTFAEIGALLSHLLRRRDRMDVGLRVDTDFRIPRTDIEALSEIFRHLQTLDHQQKAERTGLKSRTQRPSTNRTSPTTGNRGSRRFPRQGG